MTLDVILSGPRSSEPQARTALASAGYTVQATVDNHGLPDQHTEEDREKKPKQPVAFITVTTVDDQLAAVTATAATLGYRLRMHHDTPPEPEPDPLTATLEDMQREINELKARLDPDEGLVRP